MDIHSSAEITDREAIEEFLESLNDIVTKIERDIAYLKTAPKHRETIESLYRLIRNIKDDAVYYKIDLAVKLFQPIESLVVRVRNNEISFDNLLPDALESAFDQINPAIEGLLVGENSATLPKLIGGLEKIAAADAKNIDACASEMIESLTGSTTAKASGKAQKTASSSQENASSTFSATNLAQKAEDLRFFLMLANQLESRSEIFKGRTLRLLRLALKTNEIRNKVIDPMQLEAAVYMHDVGMMFLPEKIWLKPEFMSPEERELLRTHPNFSAGLLARITGWDDAAKMIAQHHEMPDGMGYPKRLHADEICDGAKLLAIVDAFESIMLKHSQRGKNRSILRAIAEINACNNQFAPEWIEPFNQVIRQTVEV